LTVYVRLITLSPQSENSNLSRKDVLKIEIVRAFVTEIPYTFATKTLNRILILSLVITKKAKQVDIVC